MSESNFDNVSTYSFSCVMGIGPASTAIRSIGTPTASAPTASEQARVAAANDLIGTAVTIAEIVGALSVIAAAGVPAASAGLAGALGLALAFNITRAGMTTIFFVGGDAFDAESVKSASQFFDISQTIKSSWHKIAEANANLQLDRNCYNAMGDLFIDEAFQRLGPGRLAKSTSEKLGNIDRMAKISQVLFSCGPLFETRFTPVTSPAGTINESRTVIVPAANPSLEASPTPTTPRLP